MAKVTITIEDVEEGGISTTFDGGSQTIPEQLSPAQQIGLAVYGSMERNLSLAEQIMEAVEAFPEPDAPAKETLPN